MRTALLVAVFYTLVTLAWMQFASGQQAHNLGTMVAFAVICYRQGRI
jgi:hypothetical protein